ncbi:MAG: carbamoyltransferase HypF [Dehalococcoidia bacterium]|nr:carbamoyltransferase HypF [Dehalococcoidia bacterium]
MSADTRANQARRISIFGVVQGVGFRPFIYQLAQRHQLRGWVRNTSGYVEIAAEGPVASLEAFTQDIEHQAPPAAHIQHLAFEDAPLRNLDDFSIRESLPRPDEYQLISPDLATCADCQREIFDPANRRYRYPFTNCTNCGPRFTIIEDIPYDRPRTTMRAFTMCSACQQEYDDPSDRRFHAQPNACPICGPKIKLVDARGNEILGDPLSQTATILREGGIIALKGLGGFLLACDATNEDAVSLLRTRKRRPSRPFAIMLRDLDKVKEYCTISSAEEALLRSPAAPIVLLKIQGKALAPAVAPGLGYLGAMLPYTPLHHLLVQEADRPLVMTSGNLSEEPIARDNHEATARLGKIADYFVFHDRDIYVRYDDSVAMCTAEKISLIRRARGYAPHPIKLSFKAPRILACGAELKSTFCLTRDDYAFISQHVGDLENDATLANYEELIEVYQRLFRTMPELIACDLHPDYLSTQYALKTAARSALPLISIQHHHAHIASLLTEHSYSQPVIGVIFDGTGYGTDGTVWGGEFLHADISRYRRLAHLEYLPLPGGDAATRKPYRIAAAYLCHLWGTEGFATASRLVSLDHTELEIIKTQLDRRLNTLLTSSAGRLFDAVAALVGIRQVIDYEAQAAIELEMAATSNELPDERVYPFGIPDDDSADIRLAPLFRAIIADIDAGCRPAEIARRFHRSTALMIAKVCHKLSGETGITTVGLSGGCFQNRLLLEMTTAALGREGLQVLSHRQVPPGDGGIALGQAAIAAEAFKNKECVA